LSPFVFDWVSDGMSYVGGESSWALYVLHVFGAAALVMLPPVTLLGSVFPYLMKVSEATSTGVGRTVGNLIALNTAGAIVGSLLAGFVLLDAFGLWVGIRLAAAGYLAGALLLGARYARSGRLVPLGTAGAVLVVLLVVDTARLPAVKLDDTPGAERLLEVWEDSAATVAVVEKRLALGIRDSDGPSHSLRIKVNNYYTLGGTAAHKWESWQSHLPLWLHEAPRSVYYLGMGTGITAGAALHHPVERVLVTEIVPAAVTAARRYFRPYVNGLFDDARARVIVEDGRNYLLGSTQRFDVIVADLFMPWKSGTGSLYTREHYRAARDRLTDSGLLVQWLPLYQMGAEEFGTIARTLLDVFPMVTLWRGDFFSAAPSVALIGHRQRAPLARGALQQRLARAANPASAETPLYHFVPDTPHLLQRRDVPSAAARFLLYYAGNLSAAATLFDDYPVNTDDRPVIEYRAPITERREVAGGHEWFTGNRLIAFLDRLLATVPPAQDPYLAQFTAAEWELVHAGLLLHRGQVLEYVGDVAQAQIALSKFARIVFPYAP
ncbi:MAG: fused MFS/spermidine synthase, partial [Gammaproteobacteria bacterium]|nr:fused MFS/spermidine synthase [Gammaproteobacteria bacterium]